VADAPPPRWCAAGAEGALEAATSVARAFAREGPAALAPARLPAGWRLVKGRSMRAVLRASLPVAGRETVVYVKAHRAPDAAARAKALVRGGRGPAEGSTLAALAARGVAVAEPLAWSADGPDDADVLVLRGVEGAASLQAIDRDALRRGDRTRVAEAVGRLLRLAHDAGWRQGDLHRDHVLVRDDGAVLLDVGGRPLRDPRGAARRPVLLGAAGHGLAPDPRDALRALRAYAGGDRATARRLLEESIPFQRIVARAYRRGRARRARRTGLHFEAFRPAGARAAMRATGTPPAWRDAALAWLVSDPPGAVALKDGGDVLAARLPGRDAPVVLKRFAPSWKDRFRTPRAIRAFRRAYALRIRGVACPEPLLAVVDAKGRGLYVASQAGAPPARAVDLHRAAHGEAGALPPRARRDALARLGRFLRRMHDAEVVHRDLKAPNLVAWRGGTGVEFAIVDLEGARVAPRAVHWMRRARDLARLDASLEPAAASRADRLRVVRGYYATWGRLPVDERAFARLVARLHARKRARLLATRAGAAAGPASRGEMRRSAP